MRTQYRHRLACAGALLIGAASALRAEPLTSRPTDTTSRGVVQYALFLMVVLVGIFLVSSFAFLRWSKHFRRRVLRKPADPTPAEDVWAMHRLPEEEPDDPDEEERP
jgi:hypothetical protein